MRYAYDVMYIILSFLQSKNINKHHSIKKKKKNVTK